MSSQVNGRWREGRKIEFGVNEILNLLYILSPYPSFIAIIPIAKSEYSITLPSKATNSDRFDPRIRLVYISKSTDCILLYTFDLDLTLYSILNQG